MKYMSHDGHQLMTKNKLQKAVQDHLKSIDRVLIPDAKSLSELKTNIIAHIVFFNNEHPRCAPIAAHWQEMDKNDWLLVGVNFSHFYIYHIKTDY